MVKGGFLIDGDKIYDTKIQSYSLKKEYKEGILVYSMIPSGYKRLYDFEILLELYDADHVFKILMFNSKLKKDREKELDLTKSRMNYMGNYSTIYNYPVKYLTKKRFNCYKICQSLKRRLD